MTDQVAMDRIAQLRTFYARHVAAKGNARDPRVERAFATVAREPFAGPGPWSVPVLGYWSWLWSLGKGYVQTPSNDPAFLYQDTLIALDAARGINIGEPSFHARCLDQLAPLEGSTVLHVGAGSGYYTALLANLVGPTGHVHAYEIDPVLAARAAHNLAHLPYVELHARSGIAEGLPAADRVYVNAGITQPSWAWLEALRPGGGRLMFPLQPTTGVGGRLLVERPPSGHVWPARFVSRALFIGCVGRQDEAMDRDLKAAFARGNVGAVRSLWLDGEPDASCWCAGTDWWLSTEAPGAAPGEVS